MKFDVQHGFFLMVYICAKKKYAFLFRSSLLMLFVQFAFVVNDQRLQWDVPCAVFLFCVFFHIPKNRCHRTNKRTAALRQFAYPHDGVVKKCIAFHSIRGMASNKGVCSRFAAACEDKVGRIIVNSCNKITFVQTFSEHVTPLLDWCESIANALRQEWRIFRFAARKHGTSTYENIGVPVPHSNIRTSQHRRVNFWCVSISNIIRKTHTHR